LEVIISVTFTMVARYMINDNATCRKKKITWETSEIVRREGERVVPFCSSVHAQGPKVHVWIGMDPVELRHIK
jgi:hypothetical protein